MTPEIDEDKWYRRWWSWTPDQIISLKEDVTVVKRIIELANNRAVVGAYRYEVPRFGCPTKPCGKSWDMVGLMRQKLDAYASTGNKEFLVDVFNYLRWEYARPGHPNAHFKAADQGDGVHEA